MSNVQNLVTIREAAKAGIMTEHYLRLMVAQRRCPGIRIGNRFMINIPLLLEQIDRESRANAQGNTQTSGR